MKLQPLNKTENARMNELGKRKSLNSKEQTEMTSLQKRYRESKNSLSAKIEENTKEETVKTVKNLSFPTPVKKETKKIELEEETKEEGKKETSKKTEKTEKTEKIDPPKKEEPKRNPLSLVKLTGFSEKQLADSFLSIEKNCNALGNKDVSILVFFAMIKHCNFGNEKMFKIDLLEETFAIPFEKLSPALQIERKLLWTELVTDLKRILKRETLGYNFQPNCFSYYFIATHSETI